MGKRYDLVVLGGGTAGLVSSMIAAGAGARVALVERDRTGGDCLWTGCVPSKALIASAGVAHTVREAGSFGVKTAEPDIDFRAVMERVRAIRRQIEPHDSPDRLRETGVEVLEEEGRFLGPGMLRAGNRDLRFRSAIVATGSSPVIPPVPGLAGAEPLTTESIWDLDVLPERLAVIGGGPIGCELGQAFARLGSKVTIVEMADRLLEREEPEASALIAETLIAEGIDLRIGTRLAGVERAGGETVLALAGDRRDRDDGPDEEKISATHLLVATGRAPRTAGFGLGEIGVEVDAGGRIAVDDRLRTSARGVYAAGDVTGALPFTHVAAQQARLATPNALFGLRQKISYESVPWVTFTDPEVARVGLSEAAARERWGGTAQVASFDYEELDRAITGGRTAGFAKLVGDRRGRLVGATIAAAGAGEAIGELAAWITSKAGIADVSRQVHAYPTLSEGPARAANAHLAAKLLTPRNRALMRPLLAGMRFADQIRRRSRTAGSGNGSDRS